MDDKSHLPVVASLADLKTLADLEECALIKLAQECARWLRAISEQKGMLVTPAAKTVWTALIQQEVELVSGRHKKLLCEIEARSPCEHDGVEVKLTRTS